MRQRGNAPLRVEGQLSQGTAESLCRSDSGCQPLRAPTKAMVLATHAPQERAKGAPRSSDGRASGELTSGNREASASVFS
jgi:hypothetical protein